MICSHMLAADAGMAVLNDGGNAVDAAIATALTLSVVDPPNCTLAGYGGYMVVKKPGDPNAEVVCFNTAVPKRYSPDDVADTPRITGFVYGPRSVSVPGVPAGLLKAHEQFGSVEFKTLCTSAIGIAKDGFKVGKNLAKALEWAGTQIAATNPAWRDIFAPGGAPFRLGDRLVQADLSKTLEYYAQSPSSFYTGPIGQKLVNDVQASGGVLESSDMAAMRAVVLPADRCEFQGYELQGTVSEESGFGILKDTVNSLTVAASGLRPTPKEYISALQRAWASRSAEFTTPKSPIQHTNHFCVSDAQGMMVACTFTLGPLWFGSLSVLEGTGLVLNCGMNLIRQNRRSGDFVVINNLTPVIGHDAQNRWYAAGTPGGTRIPAVVLRLFLETAVVGRSLQDAIDLPRIAVRPDGTPELEAIFDIDEPYKTLGAEDFYGPASIIRRDTNGDIEIGQDPRFEVGVAVS